MKVLLIDVNCKSSSTGKIVYDLYSYLNKNGNTAAVCYGRGERINEKNIYKFGLDWETYLHAFLTRVTGLTGRYSCLSTRRLIKFIENYNPDIIHIHELHAYFVNIKPLINYLKKKQIPVVWTFHCEFMYTGKCGVTYECTRFMKGCGKCPHLKEYPKTMFFDFSHRMWEEKKKLLNSLGKLVIVTPSRWLRDRTKTTFLKNREIITIHNGINVNIFKPSVTKEAIRKEFNIKDNKIVLSVASHITTDLNKGARYIFEIAEEMKDKNVHFLLVGSDDSEIFKKNNITVIPAIRNQNKLAELYAAADVFLICSEKENFPTTCIESQCCGTPVCGFDVGGVSETIVDSAMLCSYGDLTLLKENICKMIDKKELGLLDELGRRSAEKFSVLQMADSYYELYKKVLQEM